MLGSDRSSQVNQRPFELILQFFCIPQALKNSHDHIKRLPIIPPPSLLCMLWCIIPHKDLHCLEEVGKSGDKWCQNEEVVEREGPVEADLLTNHLHSNGKCWPKVRVDHDVQEPHNDATPYSQVVDLGIEKRGMGIKFEWYDMGSEHIHLPMSNTGTQEPASS